MKSQLIALLVILAVAGCSTPYSEQSPGQKVGTVAGGTLAVATAAATIVGLIFITSAINEIE